MEAYDQRPCFESETKYSKRGKELNELIELNHQKKISKSLEIVSQALDKSENPVISSSFGKDSIVLIHLVHQFDSVPIIFNKTGVQFKETIDFMKKIEEEWNLDLAIVKPRQSFWEIVDEYGYPKESRNSKTGDRRQPKCCKILKEDPMREFIKENEIDLDFVGLCGDEGRQRRWAYIQKGSAYYEHKTWNVMKCIPLIFWESENIWKYIKSHDLPINPAYEKYDVERTGCIPCTGHKGWKKQIRKISQGLYNRIRSDLGIKTIDDFV